MHKTEQQLHNKHQQRIQYIQIDLMANEIPIKPLRIFHDSVHRSDKNQRTTHFQDLQKQFPVPLMSFYLPIACPHMKDTRQKYKEKEENKLDYQPNQDNIRA